MEIPIKYNCIEIINSTYSPSSFVLTDNRNYYFFCRYLWQKVISIFKFNLPETVSKDLFLNALFGNGCVAMLPTDEFGFLAQWCRPGGYNVNFEPRFVLIANPLLPEISARELIIGEDVAVIKLTHDWAGVADLVGFYAEKLALASQAIDINFINTRLAYVFGAADKQQAKSFKMMFDKILNGEPAVVIDKSLFREDGSPNWTLFQQDIKSSYIVSDLLVDLHKIEDEFDTVIGIPNANTEKRERLNVDEVNANNVETEIRAASWLENIKRGCKMVRDMYNIDITVDWRYKPNDMVQSTNGSGNPVDSGAV